MSDLTPAEETALEARGIPRDQVILVEATVNGIQLVGQAVDPTGKPVLVLAFLAGVPADLLRPRPVILGADGQPIGGGLAGAMPIPPTVRLLVPLDQLSPAYVPVRPSLVIPPLEAVTP